MQKRAASTRAAADTPNAKGWTDDTERLLADWERRSAVAKVAHYELTETYRRRYNLLGIPAVILASVVGTSLFATIGETSIDWRLRLAGGFVSVLSAVFAGLQTFLRYGELAERHMVAADWYAAVNRRIHQLQALQPGERGDAKACLDELRKELAKIGQQSPAIGERTWERIGADFGIEEAVLRRSRVAP